VSAATQICYASFDTIFSSSHHLFALVLKRKLMNSVRAWHRFRITGILQAWFGGDYANARTQVNPRSKAYRFS
jgi:hypothetical protein